MYISMCFRRGTVGPEETKCNHARLRRKLASLRNEKSRQLISKPTVRVVRELLQPSMLAFLPHCGIILSLHSRSRDQKRGASILRGDRWQSSNINLAQYQ